MQTADMTNMLIRWMISSQYTIFLSFSYDLFLQYFDTVVSLAKTCFNIYRVAQKQATTELSKMADI